jgi:hypothetical protein
VRVESPTREQVYGAWVIAKTNFSHLLERELAPHARSGRMAAATIFMSSATDPSGRVERHLGLRRRALSAARVCAGAVDETVDQHVAIALGWLVATTSANPRRSVDRKRQEHWPLCEL